MVREPYLNGYQIMWMYIMFDLPVVEEQDRQAATRFRQFLLDLGFQMSQYSIYYRCLAGKEWVEKLQKKIANHVPFRGKVDIMVITDKQFGNMVCYRGKKTVSQPVHEQLLLF